MHEHNNERWNVFVSHASEDKDSFARPFARRLAEMGLSVWFDEFVLKPGDSLRRSLDKGLGSSEFVVAVLSKHFFKKQWTQRELDAVFSRETLDKNIIIPIWYNTTADDVQAFSPMLADRLAITTTDPVKAADQVCKTLLPDFPIGELSGPCMESKISIAFHLLRDSANPIIHRIESDVSGLIPVVINQFNEHMASIIGDRIPSNLLFITGRELLVNAIAHRSYDDDREIAVNISLSKISVCSPGRLVRPLTVESLPGGHVVVARNPKMVHELVQAGYMEAIGAGLLRLSQLLDKTGLSPLNFIEDDNMICASLGIPKQIGI